MMSLQNGKLAWSVWKPTKAEPWDFRRVVHLHGRAGFGATWNEIEQDVADGPETAVERVLAGKSQRDGVPDQFEDLAKTIGEAAVAAGSIDRLKAWWAYRMLMTPDPLGERIALMWHNHFATSHQKVNNVSLMHEQNQIFRKHGRGEFGELLKRVVKQPAMLIWLDADANRSQHPNENLARELMELFTLGEGNYTEPDVQEAARALTGWVVSRERFREVAAYHDAGSKTILKRTRRYDGDELLDLLAKQPATARRIAWRLCDTFLGEDQPGREAIEELAKQLEASNLNIQQAIGTILKSRTFIAESNLNAQVRSPADFIFGTVRALELFNPPPSTLIVAEQLADLGQDLFNPPNVFGWQGGRSWINTRSLLGRNRFAADLISGRLHQSRTPLAVFQLAKKYKAATNLETQLRFFTKLLTGRACEAEFAQQVFQQTARLTGDSEDVSRELVAAVLTHPTIHLG